MAQEVLVDELKKLARELEKAVGPVALLMLLPADSASEEAWNVLVSARAFDHRSRKEALNELAAHLRGALSDPVKSSITRAGLRQCLGLNSVLREG